VVVLSVLAVAAAVVVVVVVHLDITFNIL